MLDITEVELKDDLGVCSVGHRKNFLKSQEHLKKVYSKNRMFNQTIRAKLKKFYEKHKNHLRSSHYLQFNNKFNSIRSNYNTTEIIEEDQNDQSSFKEEFVKTSEITNMNANSSENQPHKKVSFENFADDDEVDFVKEQEKQTPPLSKKKSKSPMIDSVKENNKTNEEGNNKVVSESDSSSDSSSSSDEDTNQTTPLKKKKEKSANSSTENKMSNHLHIQVPKRNQKNAKYIQYSSSLDSDFF